MAWQKPLEVDLETFDPTNTEYSDREREAYADAILRADIKENGNVNHILFKEHIDSRKRREVLVATGEVDPTLTHLMGDKDHPGRTSGDGQRMYNRTHPQGRKVNSEKQRQENGASYYR